MLIKPYRNQWKKIAKNYEKRISKSNEGSENDNYTSTNNIINKNTDPEEINKKHRKKERRRTKSWRKKIKQKYKTEEEKK